MPQPHCETALRRSHYVIARPLWAEAIFDSLPGTSLELEIASDRSKAPVLAMTGSVRRCEAALGRSHHVIARPPWAEAIFDSPSRELLKREIASDPLGAQVLAMTGRWQIPSRSAVRGHDGANTKMLMSSSYGASRSVFRDKYPFPGIVVACN